MIISAFLDKIPLEFDKIPFDKVLDLLQIGFDIWQKDMDLSSRGTLRSATLLVSDLLRPDSDENIWEGKSGAE